MSEFLRVRPASQGGAVAVRHPVHGEYVVPDPRLAYAADDPLVVAYRWMFVTPDEEAAALAEGPVTSVPIEQATAAPGERRATKRTRR